MNDILKFRLQVRLQARLVLSNVIDRHQVYFSRDSLAVLLSPDPDYREGEGSS